MHVKKTWQTEKKYFFIIVFQHAYSSYSKTESLAYFQSNCYDLKAASPYHQALLGRGGPYYTSYRPMPADDPSRVTKVATRESTSALKAWLSEHLKNPYPTKGEKIMLAIVTKMSLTQVSTWFANARRRLKKENRVSWASKGKSDEEDEEEEGESEEEGSLRKGTEDEDEIDPQTVDDDDEEDDVAVSNSVEDRLAEGLDQQKESDKSDTSCESKKRCANKTSTSRNLKSVSRGNSDFRYRQETQRFETSSQSRLWEVVGWMAFKGLILARKPLHTWPAQTKSMKPLSKTL